MRVCVRAYVRMCKQGETGRVSVCVREVIYTMCILIIHINVCYIKFCTCTYIKFCFCKHRPHIDGVYLLKLLIPKIRTLN